MCAFKRGDPSSRPPTTPSTSLVESTANPAAREGLPHPGRCAVRPNRPDNAPRSVKPRKRPVDGEGKAGDGLLDVAGQGLAVESEAAFPHRALRFPRTHQVIDLMQQHAEQAQAELFRAEFLEAAARCGYAGFGKPMDSTGRGDRLGRAGFPQADPDIGRG